MSKLLFPVNGKTLEQFSNGDSISEVNSLSLKINAAFTLRHDECRSQTRAEYEVCVLTITGRCVVVTCGSSKHVNRSTFQHLCVSLSFCVFVCLYMLVSVFEFTKVDTYTEITYVPLIQCVFPPASVPLNARWVMHLD